METLENKKLRQVYVWFSVYMDSLDKVVKDDDYTYFREQGGRFAVVSIKKNELKCFVHWRIWGTLKKSFSLGKDEIELVVGNWVENVFGLKNVHTQINDDWERLVIENIY